MSLILEIVLIISSEDVTYICIVLFFIMPSMMTINISHASDLEKAEPLATGQIFSLPFSSGFYDL